MCPDFSTTTLLGFDIKTQQDILDGLKRARELSERDGKDHDLTMYFSKLNLGLTFVVTTKRKPDFATKIENYCKGKLYQTRLAKWILITVDILKDKREVFDFRIYEQEWQYDAKRESQVQEYKAKRLSAFLSLGREIKRNDLCICNSGKKYKKCCGK